MYARGQRLVLVVVLSGILGGCAVFLPAHSRSNKRGQERVAIRLLDLPALKQSKNYLNGYEQAFGVASIPSVDPCKRPDSRAEVAPVAALASIAIGFAVDFIKQRLEQEASLYEAQFSVTATDDKFWCLVNTVAVKPTKRVVTTTRRVRKSDSDDSPWRLDPPVTQVTEEISVATGSASWAQRYYAFEVIRSVEENWFDRQGEDERREASRIVFGLRPSADQQMLRVAPIYYQAGYAKAKVLSDEWFSWLVLPVFGKLLKVPGHYLDVEIGVELDGYWRAPDQQLRTTRVAAFTTQVNGYDLDTSQALLPDAGLGSGTGGWLVGVPVSYGPEGTPAVGRGSEAGTFALRLIVTERDSSNAKKYLLRAAELVGERGKQLAEDVAK